VKRGLLLNVVIRQGTSILQLLSCKNQTLLVGWDPLLVLDLRFHVVNGVLRLDLQRDGLPSECLDKNLHSTTETENEVQSGFLLDVVVGEGPTILELFAGKDETLLIGWDALLVLNLGFDVVDRVGRLNLEGDSLASQGLHENLHSTTQTKNKVESRLLLDVVIRKGTAIFELLSSKNKALLIGRDTNNKI